MSDDLDAVQRMARALEADAIRAELSGESGEEDYWLWTAQAALAALCAGPLPRAVLHRAIEQAISGSLMRRLVEQFEKEVFCSIDSSGRIIPMPDEPADWQQHPLAGLARWVGGRHDVDVVRAALTRLAELAREKGDG